MTTNPAAMVAVIAVRMLDLLEAVVGESVPSPDR
jgi:hypothetical protein